MPRGSVVDGGASIAARVLCDVWRNAGGAKIGDVVAGVVCLVFARRDATFLCGRSF
jgi:hypothetical protein